MKDESIQIEKDGISIMEDALTDAGKRAYRSLCQKYDDYIFDRNEKTVIHL